MKCPMIVKYDTDELPIENPIPIDCLHEDCAWWSKKSAQCAALAYYEAIDRLTMILHEIKNRIRPETFRNE